MINDAEIVGHRRWITISKLGASDTSFTALTIPNERKYIVKNASTRFGTASSSGTVQVEVAGKGVALGSGVNQLDSTLSLAGTVDTAVSQKVSKPTIFDKDSAVNVILGGTLTSLANCEITIELERVN